MEHLHHVAARRILKQLEFAQAVFFCACVFSRGSARASVRECPEQWGISKFASGQSHTVALSRKHLLTLFPQNSLRDFCGSPEIIPQNSLRDFCGSPEIIPQNSLRDFCGSPETARSMCRFQVRKWSKPHSGFVKKALAHPPNPPQKNTSSFFGDPGGGA